MMISLIFTIHQEQRAVLCEHTEISLILIIRQEQRAVLKVPGVSDLEHSSLLSEAIARREAMDKEASKV